MLYLVVRKLAPLICRYLALEEGFSVLHSVVPKHDAVAVDVGSNDGTSVALISKFLPISNIICFDPIREPRIPRNMRNQVRFMKIALGDSVFRQTIHTPLIGRSLLTQYSSFHKESLVFQLTHDLGIEPGRVTILRTEVEVQTLDQHDLSIFFLKIDVEGSELSVLRGATKTVERCRPIILVEIQNAEVYKQIKEFMDSLGYENGVFTHSRLLWILGPQSSQIKMISGFTAQSNNYLWFPKGESPTWGFRK